MFLLPLAGGNVFCAVCLSVCEPCVGLHKNYWPDFHETWWKGVALFENEPITFFLFANSCYLMLLSRLLCDVVFTIHTYFCPLAFKSRKY